MLSNPAVSLMLVEDHPGDAALVRDTLRQIDTMQFVLSHHTRLSDGLEALQLRGCDLILLDLSLPCTQGMESVRRVMAVAPDTPIVVLTGSDDERLAVESVKAGAQDYLVKGQITATQLQRSIRYALERHRTQSLLRNMSLIDELTGLHNRRGFLAAAENHLKLLRRTGRSAALAVIDLDGLKRINDTQGHLMGDHALIEAARNIRHAVRATDIAARVGGDEFYILFLEITSATIPGLYARLENCAKQSNTEARPYQLSFSIGIVEVPPTSEQELSALLDQADAVMYQAKQAKKRSLLLSA